VVGALDPVMGEGLLGLLSNEVTLCCIVNT
jgi:hypothetical protein